MPLAANTADDGFGSLLLSVLVLVSQCSLVFSNRHLSFKTNLFRSVPICQIHVFSVLLSVSLLNPHFPNPYSPFSPFCPFLEKSSLPFNSQLSTKKTVPRTSARGTVSLPSLRKRGAGGEFFSLCPLPTEHCPLSPSGSSAKSTSSVFC